MLMEEIKRIINVLIPGFEFFIVMWYKLTPSK